jgi:hypothetical protein
LLPAPLFPLLIVDENNFMVFVLVVLVVVVVVLVFALVLIVVFGRGYSIRCVLISYPNPTN